MVSRWPSSRNTTAVLETVPVALVASMRATAGKTPPAMASSVGAGSFGADSWIVSTGRTVRVEWNPPTAKTTASMAAAPTSPETTPMPTTRRVSVRAVTTVIGVPDPSSEGWRQRRSSWGRGGPNPGASSGSSSRGTAETIVRHRGQGAAPSRRQRGRVAYDGRVTPPAGQDDWVGLSADPLPFGAAADWAVLPRCGAVVVFSGTARDHSIDRHGVSVLEYEAYEEQALPRMRAIAAEARTRWPDLGRLALLHRTGPVPIGSSAVVVVASAPHRGEAFDAARFVIDALKATVPIWKRETWEDGESWGLEAQHLVELDDLPDDLAQRSSMEPSS